MGVGVSPYSTLVVAASALHGIYVTYDRVTKYKCFSFLCAISLWDNTVQSMIFISISHSNELRLHIIHMYTASSKGGDWSTIAIIHVSNVRCMVGLTLLMLATMLHGCFDVGTVTSLLL